MSDEKSDPVDESPLTPEQKQRAAALTEARFLLAATGMAGQRLPEYRSVQDVLTLADYILGVGPWAPLEEIGAIPVPPEFVASSVPYDDDEDADFPPAPTAGTV